MIRRIDITGYRLLHEFSADLGPLTVVIGANATGKSTLLDFLQFVSQCAEFPLKEALDWHGGLFSISNASHHGGQLRWEIVLEKPPRLRYAGAIPLPADVEFAYEVSIGRDPYWQAADVHEVLSTVDPHPGYTRPLRYLESHPNRSLIFDRRKRKLVPFDEVMGDSPTEQTQAAPAASAERLNSQIPQAPQPGAGLRLSQMRFLNEYPECSWVRLLLASVRTYPGFEVGRFSGVRLKPADIKPETLLSPSGENLGTVLHEILTRHDFRETAESLRGFLRSAYPTFVEINAETAYGAAGKVLVRLREAGMDRPMELWDISDGMLRFLCLSAALLNPNPPPALVIDEPEAGLHPRLLPIVSDLIKTASERTQVVVTTHSPDLLDSFALDELAVMTRDEACARWHRPASRQSLRKMLETVAGETLGDLHRTGELEAF